MTTIETLREWMATELKGKVRDLAESDSLLEHGVLDSMAIVKLIAFLEERFGVTLTDEEFDPENFETLTAIDALVERKRSV
jgi:acyl carrier protein